MSASEAMPLDVLLQAMRLRWQEGLVEEAVALAKAAAPYVHAKPTGGRGAVSLSRMGDDELDELCAAALYRAPDPGGGPGEP